MSLEYLLVPFLFPIQPLQMFLGPPPVRYVWDVTFDSPGCQVVHLSIDSPDLLGWVAARHIWWFFYFCWFVILSTWQWCRFFLQRKICGIGKWETSQVSVDMLELMLVRINSDFCSFPTVSVLHCWWLWWLLDYSWNAETSQKWPLLW